MKEVNITVNGKAYSVKVGDVTSSPVHVEVDGKSFQVELDVSSTTEARLVSEVQLNSPVVKMASAPVSKPQPAGNTGKSILSPMPGTIVLITAKAGDTVKRGDSLLSLEAMKMKNAIRSPFDGTIKEIHVADGQKVAHNDVLVTFE
jgi:biotin carboxyl carrier protein